MVPNPEYGLFSVLYQILNMTYFGFALVSRRREKRRRGLSCSLWLCGDVYGMLMLESTPDLPDPPAFRVPVEM